MVPVYLSAAEKAQSASLAVKAKRELQQRVAEVEQDVSKTETQLLAVTSDMTRQHKVRGDRAQWQASHCGMVAAAVGTLTFPMCRTEQAMEEKYLNKINRLENEITSLKDELGASFAQVAARRVVGAALLLAALRSRRAHRVRGHVC